nr:hypothetical protein [uncultured Intestinibacter sp.]
MSDVSNNTNIQYDKYNIEFILNEFETNSARAIYNLSEISKKYIIVMESGIVNSIKDKDDNVEIQIVTEENYRKGFGYSIDIMIQKEKISDLSENIYKLNPGDKIVVLLAPEFKSISSGIRCNCYDLRCCRFGYITQDLKIKSKEESIKLSKKQNQDEKNSDIFKIKHVEELTKEEIKEYSNKYEIYLKTGNLNKEEYLSQKQIKNEITYRYVLIVALIAIVIFLLTKGLLRIVLEVFALAIIGGSIIVIKENKEQKEQYLDLLKACYEICN